MANIELMDTEDEQKFYHDVHEILNEAKSKTYETANNIMTYAYWNVGKRIIEQEQKGNIKSGYFKRIFSTQFPEKNRADT